MNTDTNFTAGLRNGQIAAAADTMTRAAKLTTKQATTLKQVRETFGAYKFVSVLSFDGYRLLCAGALRVEVKKRTLDALVAKGAIKRHDGGAWYQAAQ